jgi:hypothetical protein
VRNRVEAVQKANAAKWNVASCWVSVRLQRGNGCLLVNRSIHANAGVAAGATQSCFAWFY